MSQQHNDNRIEPPSNAQRLVQRMAIMVETSGKKDLKWLMLNMIFAMKRSYPSMASTFQN